MTAKIIPFPPRGPFAVRVLCDDDGWLVVCRSHDWLHGSLREAFLDAATISAGFGIGILIDGQMALI
jgi:hypothetical protein